MQKEEWWRPENLEKSESEFRKKNINIDKLDLKDDFGSYRKVLLTDKFKNSGLETHNDLNPEKKINALNKIFGPFNPLFVLDAGCGMGFTTVALQKSFPYAQVLGVDISKDAIEFCSKRHQGPKFITKAISPNLEPLGRFDLIYCFEFYPFTRNTDLNFR